MKRMMRVAVLVGTLALCTPAMRVSAQDAAPAADAGALVTAAGGDAAETKPAANMGLWAVIMSSGALGVLLWIGLFGAGAAGIYFVVDCSITIRTKRIMPQSLIDNVNQAMTEGDVLKALKSCENEPGPLANVLTAGFSHVEEGFDIIQESIATAANLETEKLMQKITWLSVCANLAPMLGLLGTVQGMIYCFANLGSGAPDVAVLAVNIAQALYTTAAGLLTAVPCVTVYYVFRNAANRIVLRMEAMTMELIKDLRNVEVVTE